MRFMHAIWCPERVRRVIGDEIVARCRLLVGTRGNGWRFGHRNPSDDPSIACSSRQPLPDGRGSVGVVRYRDIIAHTRRYAVSFIRLRALVAGVFACVSSGTLSRAQSVTATLVGTVFDP